MLPRGRAQATAGGEPVPVVDTVHRTIARSPLPLRPVLALFAVAFLPWLLAPISVYRGVRSTMASLYVAAFGTWTFCVIDLDRAPASSVGAAGRVGRVECQALRVTPGVRARRASRARRAGHANRRYRACIRNYLAAQCDLITRGRP